MKPDELPPDPFDQTPPADGTEETIDAAAAMAGNIIEWANLAAKLKNARLKGIGVKLEPEEVVSLISLLRMLVPTTLKGETDADESPGEHHG